MITEPRRNVPDLEDRRVARLADELATELRHRGQLLVHTDDLHDVDRWRRAARRAARRLGWHVRTGVSGTVEDFTLRRTTLRDGDGVVHSVPNGVIEVASNLTRVWAQINENVAIAYGTNIDEATRVVDDVGTAMAADPEWQDRLLEAPRVVEARVFRDGALITYSFDRISEEEIENIDAELRPLLK